MADKKKRPVALIDLDGTLADFHGQMWADLMHSMSYDEFAKHESAILAGDEKRMPDWLVRLRDLIKRQPDWWYNLPPLPSGFKVVQMLRRLEFKLHILSRGPKRNASAWDQKVRWVLNYFDDAQITIGHDKSLVYGKVLVDDWPAYVEPWLDVRPRGLVIMPAQPWNEGFKHDRAVRFAGNNEHEVFERLSDQRATVEPVDAEWDTEGE